MDCLKTFGGYLFGIERKVLPYFDCSLTKDGVTQHFFTMNMIYLLKRYLSRWKDQKHCPFISHPNRTQNSFSPTK